MGRIQIGKIERKRECGYLYPDGTLVELFKENRNGIEIGETVDLTFGYCKVAIEKPSGRTWRERQATEGRIVVHNGLNTGFIPLARGGSIEARMPSLENGSQNTQSRGYQVQGVKLTTAKGLVLYWSDVTSLISSSFTLQDEGFPTEPFESYYVGKIWGSGRIWKITDLRPKSTETVAECAAGLN